MKKILTAIIVLLTVLFSSCGTLGRIELGNRMIINAIGVEKSNSGVRLHLLIPEMQNPNGEKKEETASSILTFEAETLGQAMEKAEEGTGKALLYSQSRVLILDKNLTEKADLCRILDPFLRTNLIRSDILFAVAEDDIKEIFSAQQKEAPAGDAIEELLRKGCAEGRNLCVPFYRFLSLIYENAGAACAPVLCLEEKADQTIIQADQTAIFKEGKLQYVGDGTMTRGILLLTGEMKTGSFKAQTPEGTALLQIITAKRRIRTDRKEISPVFDFTITLDLLEYTTQAGDYPEPVRKEIESCAEDALRELLQRTLSVLYRQGFDVCRLKARSTPRAQAYSQADIYSRLLYNQTNQELKFRITLRRTGKLINSR